MQAFPRSCNGFGKDVSAGTAKDPAFDKVSFKRECELQQLLQGEFAIEAAVIGSIKTLVICKEFCIREHRSAEFAKPHVWCKNRKNTLPPSVPLLFVQFFDLHVERRRENTSLPAVSQ